MKTQRELYRELVDLLTLKQFTPLMGGDMSFASKAERAKRVSKSKRVHDLADQIIALADERAMNDEHTAILLARKGGSK